MGKRLNHRPCIRGSAIGLLLVRSLAGVIARSVATGTLVTLVGLGISPAGTSPRARSSCSSGRLSSRLSGPPGSRALL